ncbi:MAG: glycine--tRNA ligase [Waddliaceae bacterium]
MLTFQQILQNLTKFWESQGCVIQQGYDLEVGAGTLNPATFLRSLGPEPFRVAYAEPCRRPGDGRYGQNPNRVQHYFQFQVLLKPCPIEMQKMYVDSLKSIGLNLSEHDIRFVHDDWENPTIGAWGLGWEVWLDGMEVTQYTYFQSVGGVTLDPIPGELTYGVERIAMYLQKVDSIFDIQWNEHFTYGEIYKNNEVEWSSYNFEHASTSMWQRHFDDYEKEAKRLVTIGLPIPAYEFVMKASHAFNMLDARGVVSVTERTGYISRIRNLAKEIASTFIESRKEAGYPLMETFPVEKIAIPSVPKFSEELLHPKRESEDFLLEIGSEELPASFVTIGIHNLKENIEKLLKKESIPFNEIKCFATPRRLAVLIKELSFKVPTQTTEKRGPALQTAFDDAGNPTRAAEGFFRSIEKEPMTRSQIEEGFDPEVKIKEIKGSEYIFTIVKTGGESVAKILAEALPKLIKDLEFPKKMRWDDLPVTYARPLRWLVCLFGTEVVPFVLGSLLTDRKSKGHFQLSPDLFSIPDATSYEKTLQEHNVIASIKKRRESIDQQLRKLNGTVVSYDKVIKQVVNLVEKPFLIVGSFDKEFLKVPKEVLISEMVEHQKCFPIAKSNGQLQNQFIITANNTPTDEIRAGNEMVISARLSDGAFLYEKGRKISLDKHREKLSQITYIKGMGTLQDKAFRLMGHAEVLQRKLGISSYTQCRRAAQICKADLTTEMVSEFPDLQGVIGRYYAEDQGEDSEVSSAIEEHWMPKGEGAELPQTETGTLLSMADKIDNLLSCFSAGLKPTSSSDPYALRRQTIGLIRMILKGKFTFDLLDILSQCCQNFEPSRMQQPKNVLGELMDFIRPRIKTVFLEEGFRKDEIEATLSSGMRDIFDAYCKVKALHQFREHSDQFPLLFEVYKRAKGQLVDQQLHTFKKEHLKENAEITLNQTVDHIQPRFENALNERNYEKAYQMVAEIQPPLSKLFEEVKILSEDEEVKMNRLALLQKVFGLFGSLLDFSQIQE